MAKNLGSTALQRGNGMAPDAVEELVLPMPPEFQLVHPRRIRCSGFSTQPDGSTAHYSGYRQLTPEDEACYRLSDPENGLHPDDLKAFRASIQGPVMRGPVARFFARFMF